MLSRKEFERQYSVELLPSSMENYAIGDLWDWHVNVFGRRLMPEMQNVADVCKLPALRQKLVNIALQKAMLPDINLTNEFKSDASLTIPSLQTSLSNVLDVSKVESFVFSGVQGKNALGGYRTDMSEALNELKSNDFEKYKKHIRKFEVVIALYYADSVQIEVSRSISNQAEIEAKLKAIQGVEVKVDTSNEKTYKFNISGSACAFATQFEHGRDL